jgi:hypothetical protein
MYFPSVMCNHVSKIPDISYPGHRCRDLRSFYVFTRHYLI